VTALGSSACIGWIENSPGDGRGWGTVCCNPVMALDASNLSSIGAGLEDLADLLRQAKLQLPGAAATGFGRERDEILDVVDHYLMPRLKGADAPLIAAVVGPSGSGKSTLVNSLAQAPISAAGVVRPMTHGAVLWMGDGDDLEAIDRDPADPQPGDLLAGVRDFLGGDSVSVVAHGHPVSDHVSIVDTPPLGSNGSDVDVAARAVTAADLCVFVTTPTRYADGVAWSFLRNMRRRGVPVLFVLNRLPADPVDQDALLADFAQRLHERDLLNARDSSLIFGIAEDEVDARIGGIRADAVGAIRKEFDEFTDPVFREGLRSETVLATARMVGERSRALTRPVAAEQDLIEAMAAEVATAYDEQTKGLLSQLAEGGLAQLAGLEWPEASANLAGMLARRAGVAAQSTAARWRGRSEATQLVDGRGQELWRHGHETSGSLQLSLDSWRSGLETLAGSYVRRGRLRWGSGPRAVAAVWRSVLDPRRPLPRRIAKRFTGSGEPLITQARDELEDCLRSGLAFDAKRFRRLLNEESGGAFYAAVIEQTDAIDAVLDSLMLGGEIPRDADGPEPGS